MQGNSFSKQFKCVFDTNFVSYIYLKWRVYKYCYLHFIRLARLVLLS